MKKTSVFSLLLKRKVKFLVFIILILLLSFVAPYKSYVMQWIIDAADMGEVARLLLIGIGVFTLSFLLEAISRNIFTSINNKAASDIREKVYKRLINEEYTSFHKETTGNYISTLTNDIRIIQDDYYLSIFNMILYGGMFIFAVYFLFSINILFIVATAVIGVFPFLLPKIFAKVLQKSRKAQSDSVAAYSSFAKDSFAGFETIKIFGVPRVFEKKNETKSKTIEKNENKFKKIRNLNISLSSFIDNILFFALMAVGVYLVLKGQITVGYMVTATNLANFTLKPLMAMSQSISEILSTKEIRTKLEEMLKTAEEENKEEQKTQNNDIVFSNVSFDYGKRDKGILNNLNITFNEGKKYLIIGQSGSGKSTIAKLICRFYSEYDGRITYGNVDINKFSEKQFTDDVLMITQQSFLFNDTLRNNITLSDSRFTDDEILKVMKICGLSSLLDTLPEKLDTEISENGKNLSGGQLQRIAIARALIRKPKVLIADEATASLDMQTAISIEKLFLSLDMTVIFIAHKVADEIKNACDEVFEIKSGN